MCVCVCVCVCVCKNTILHQKTYKRLICYKPQPNNEQIRSYGGHTSNNTFGVMVIVFGNGLSDMNSNPGGGCLNFTY